MMILTYHASFLNLDKPLPRFTKTRSSKYCSQEKVLFLKDVGSAHLNLTTGEWLVEDLLVFTIVDLCLELAWGIVFSAAGVTLWGFYFAKRIRKIRKISRHKKVRKNFSFFVDTMQYWTSTRDFFFMLGKSRSGYPPRDRDVLVNS